jgi:hypothetical protein
MGRQNTNSIKSSPKSFKDKKGYIEKKKLLTTAIILVMVSTGCLFGKIILENRISTIEKSLKLIKINEESVRYNVDTSIKFNNDINYIKMHIGLLNLLHEKPEDIKSWHDQEINYRKMSVNCAYAAAKGKLTDKAKNEWSTLTDSGQLESIHKKYISEAEKNNKINVAKAVEYENNITNMNYWSFILIIVASFLNSMGLIIGFLSRL